MLMFMDIPMSITVYISSGSIFGATTAGPSCQNSVLKSKILSKRSGKSVDKFWGSEWSAPKSNPSGSGKPIVKGVGLKMQPAEMQAVPFKGLS